MMTVGTTAQLPAEQIADFDRKFLRCPACRSTVQRETLSGVNGERRIRAFCTSFDCAWSQLIGIGITGEIRTIDGLDDTAPPTKRPAPAPGSGPGRSTDRGSGPARASARKPAKRICVVADCDRPQVGSGLCNRHYTRWHSIGKPQGPERQRWLEAGAPPKGEWVQRETQRAEGGHGEQTGDETFIQADEGRRECETDVHASATAAPSGARCRKPYRPDRPASEGNAVTQLTRQQGDQLPTERNEPLPDPPPRPSAAPSVETSSKVAGWRERFVPFRDATELGRIDLPRHIDSIVLWKLGDYITIASPAGLVLSQVPLARSPSHQEG